MTMTYREPLPDDCPPDEAEEITSPRLVYRLVGGVPPTDDDFRSQRAEKPNAQFNVSECRARGVSVFTNLSDAERQTRRRNRPPWATPTSRIESLMDAFAKNGYERCNDDEVVVDYYKAALYEA